VPYSHLDVRVGRPQHVLAQSLRDLRTELGLQAEFPPEVLREAEQSVARHQLPEFDLTRLHFVTIDPPTSTDLDQALYLERHGTGYRAWYAITDVPSFVPAHGALDAETRRRGQTVYAPDGRIPLHPEIISEDAGSLLADELRSAFVWEFELDSAAEVLSTQVRRARVRSVAKLNYQEVQQDIDSGGAPESLMLLKEIGLKRIELERKRGGANLNMPEQEIVHDGERYFIVARPQLPVEDWNAQISLMTGMAAAQLMLDGKVGILRTMPKADEQAEMRFRRQTEALGHPWGDGLSYGDYLRTLDATNPRHLALMHAAGSLFRGADYTPFDGELPEDSIQAAIAAPYAHTTAPLRRLVDRFVLVICEALCAGREVPAAVRSALPLLPGLMAASDQLASRLDRGALDAVEAALLSNHVGQEFDAVVLSGSRPARNGNNGNGNGQGNGTDAGANGNGTGNNGNGRNGYKPSGVIQLTEPAVTAKCDGVMESGTHVRVRLLTADIVKRRIRFELA
jgi:exoribonuclease R